MIYRFGSYTLDTKLLELRCDGVICAIEPQVFDLLVFLVENRDRVVSKDQLIDTIWQGRIVSDATLSTRVNAARHAVGDSGKDQTIIRTVQRRGFHFVADVTEEETSTDQQSEAAKDSQTIAKASQAIRFCTTESGVRIAYATAGRGPALVKTANWLNHLEYDWESPVWRHVFEGLTSKYLLVRYDGRGNGLSDWDVEDISFEAFVRDLENVVDAVGLERFPLLGISQGCAISIAYATRHPERVSHLILYGGFALGWNKRAKTEAEREQGAAMLTLMRHGWGQENPTFRQLFTSQFIPGATKEQNDWFNELQQISTSPENAVRNLQACGEIDVRELLPQIKVPTLVMHARDDARIPFDAGRRMAAAIPGAQFVSLQSRNHLILGDEPAWPTFLKEVVTFLETGTESN